MADEMIVLLGMVSSWRSLGVRYWMVRLAQEHNTPHGRHVEVDVAEMPYYPAFR